MLIDVVLVPENSRAQTKNIIMTPTQRKQRSAPAAPRGAFRLSSYGSQKPGPCSQASSTAVVRTGTT